MKVLSNQRVLADLSPCTEVDKPRLIIYPDNNQRLPRVEWEAWW